MKNFLNKIETIDVFLITALLFYGTFLFINTYRYFTQ